MPTFGVTLISAQGSLIESLDIEMKADFKQILTSAGAFSEAKSYDRSYTVSVKGKGDNCPYDAGSTVSGVSSVTGKGIWTTSSEDSRNDDFQGWSASATFYANA